MLSSLKTMVIVSFLIAQFFLNVSHAAKSSKSVAVEVELEEVLNADKYELEVRRKSSNKIMPYQQQRPIFKMTLEVGHYQMRTRALSQDNIGPWSDWIELLAPPEEVNNKKEVSYGLSVDKKREQATLKLDWEASRGADQYVIWLENVIDNKKEKIKTRNTKHQLNLPVGEYRIGLQALSKDGLSSAVTYYENNFFVAKTQLPKIDLVSDSQQSYRWTERSQAEVKIEIFHKPFFSDQYVKIQDLRARGTNWRLPNSLRPGEYRIHFQYVSDTFENGPVESVEFVRKPTEPNFR